MRKFTKTHNDLAWLFPQLGKKTPEERFDSLEESAKYLLEECYLGKETFTQDEMIDAFMKGASIMNQSIAWDVKSIIDSNYLEVERIKSDLDWRENFIKELKEDFKKERDEFYKEREKLLKDK